MTRTYRQEKKFPNCFLNWLSTTILSLVLICTKSLPHFLLYSSLLVEIHNIQSPLVLFLEFEQPYIDLAILITKKLQFQNIPAKMICLLFIPSGEEWVSGITRFSTSA